MVSGVVGLDESAALIHPDHVVEGNAPPTAGFRNSPPLSAYWAELPSPYPYPFGFVAAGGSDPTDAPWAITGHTPDQIKGAYGISGSGYDGTGQTVAIIDAYASPTILQDANQWSTNRGIPQFGTAGGGTLTQVVSPGTYNVKDNRKQSPTGWYGEETLDVEAVHGMAPNANIVYVGAPNNYQDLDAAMNHVVDMHLAQIVTNSYGFNGENLPSGFIKPLNDTFIEASIVGIGIYFSSGDGGDETAILGFASTDWPASSPWVTAVGGTSLGVTSGGARAVETGWGTSSYGCDGVSTCSSTGVWIYGAGGGVSKIFAQPDYQTSYGGNLTGVAGRSVPDVAALADPNAGYLTGQTQTFPATGCNPAVVEYDEYRIGGTSLACPIFAGLMALADQKATKPHGFANPVFYANSSAFTDIKPVETAVARRNFVDGVDSCFGTSDFLRTFNDYSGSPSQSTVTGWDNVTGLGVPYGIFTP